MSAGERVAHYAGHGLLVASEFVLALRNTDPDGRACDLSLAWGSDREIDRSRPPGAPLAELTDQAGIIHASFTRSSSAVIMRYPGLCEFRGDHDLTNVTVHLHPGAESGLVSVLGSGALIAVHLTLRGELVLHASCVEVDGGAIAFVGSSGMGKSTMAAMMVRHGYPLVSDDVLRTTVVSAPPEVYAGGIEGRLRDKARELASAVVNSSTSETIDGRLSLRPQLTAAERLPVRACIIPMPSRDADTLSVRRLGPGEALRRLLQFPRILGWSDPGVLRGQFEAAADLSAQVPVYEAVVPWGPPFAESIPSALLDRLT